MGILDVKIDIQRESHYKIRNQRRESFNTRSNLNLSNTNASQNPNSVPDDDDKGMHMDPNLYRAAAEEDANGFTNALQQVLRESGESDDRIIFESISPSGNTLLHVAAKHGRDRIVKHITDNYRSLSHLTRKNSTGDTALHLAAQAGYLSVVRTLIEARKACNATHVPPGISNGGIIQNQVADDDSLLSKKNDKGNVALHEAIENYHDDLAEDLYRDDLEVIFITNEEGKSAMYLAAEAGYADLLGKMLDAVLVNGDICRRLRSNSPVHAAILGRHRDALTMLLEKVSDLIRSEDDEGMNPLHLAASIGYKDGVIYLLSKNRFTALEKDKSGSFPLHWAAYKGHLDVMQLLLIHCPNPVEFIDNRKQNILHVAAKYGRQNVVNYILKNHPQLINETDIDGNTPLHLATKNWHPKIVSALTWNKAVDLMVVNKDGFMALDVAECYMDDFPSFRQRLTWTALRSAGAKRASLDTFFKLNKGTSVEPNPLYNMIGNYKDRINTLLLVATLVATVTFSAGFAVPGGNDDNKGDATLLGYKKFHLFVFCDTMAMYSAIIVAVALIWAQLGDLHLMLIALRMGLPLLGISLILMSLAFMAGVSVVVSQLRWLADSIFIMGSVFLGIVAALAFPLCFPISSNNGILRYISYYPFHLLICVTGSHNSGDSED